MCLIRFVHAYAREHTHAYGSVQNLQESAELASQLGKLIFRRGERLGNFVFGEEATERIEAVLQFL